MSITLSALLIAAPLAATGPESHPDGKMDKVHVMMMSDEPLSRDKLKAMIRAQFTARDANDDGVLSGEELTGHAMASMMVHRGQPLKEGELKSWTDKNGKGIVVKTIGTGEDLAGPDMEELKALADPDKAFDRMDANKDGMISREEFAKGREVRIERFVTTDGKPIEGKTMRMHRMVGDHAPIMMMHIGKTSDADGDGKVTRAEAEAYALAKFDEKDKNKDGELSREERGSQILKVRKMAKSKS